jgi:hypothetical protein
MTTTQDDGFGDAEHATATPTPPAPPKVPDIVQRIGPPPHGMFTKKAPRRSYLVEQHVDGAAEPRGVIGRGQLHILAGEGGAGKGRWLLTIATALAAGDPRREAAPDNMLDIGQIGGVADVCGLNVNGIDDDEKVLLLLGEDDAIDLHQRFQGVAEALKWEGSASREEILLRRFRWGTAHGTTFTIVSVDKNLVTKEINANASDDFVALTKWLRENGPWAFIALDPMARFAGVDENDNPLQTKVFALAEGLTKVNEDCPKVNGKSREPPAILVVDHTGKPSKQGFGPVDATQHAIRGASAKVNAARVAMLMMPGEADVACVDSEGRTKADAGFDENGELADVAIRTVVWSVVKNNGQEKAKPVTLSFTKHGGLWSESGNAAQARRKSQFHAAKKRGETRTKPVGETPAAGGAKKGRKAGKPAEVASMFGADLDITGDD